MGKKGIEFDITPPGEIIRAKALTAERSEQLNAIGFVWSPAEPNMAWEDRFRICMEYCETNGRGPSQSMGSMGEWVSKQRRKYQRKDVNFMKDRAPKLDAVGFEWTPRGNTRMTWDEGFEMLMAFEKINGHFNVERPDAGVDRKSDKYRFFNWVASLHSMYRSHRLGRQAGSLTDGRIFLLVNHGFSFRND